MSCLYIGLGGTGIDAVKTVFERNQLNKKGCSKDKYFLIDTDVQQREELPEELQKSFIGIGEKRTSYWSHQYILQKDSCNRYYDAFNNKFIQDPDTTP